MTLTNLLRVRGSHMVLAGSLGVVLLVFKLASEPDSHRAGLFLSLLLAALLLPVLAKHPTATLCFLIVFVPLQVPFVAWLFDNGLPQIVARRLGALKDLAGMALLLRAYLDRGTRTPRPADRWMVLYVGVATAYLFLPIVYNNLAQIPFSQRIVAWRIETFFVLVLLALRWIDPQMLDLRAVRWTLLGVGALVAIGAIYEYYEPTAWRDFIYQTLGVRAYSIQVLSVPLNDDTLIRYSSSGAVRSGSFLREPVFCAFFLLPSFFIALTQISSRRSLGASLLTATIGTGLVFTSTRSALLVAVLGAVLASLNVLRSGGRYTRYFVPVLALMLVISPVLIAQSSVAERVTEAVSGEDSSTQGHQNDLAAGLSRAITAPLGKGLGSGAGSGQRFEVKDAVTTENAYLQVINEMGALALVAFLGFLFAMTRELSQLSPRGDGLLLDTSAARALLLAMVTGGVLQTVWLDVGVGVSAATAISLPLLLVGQEGRSTTSRTAPSSQSDESASGLVGA